MTEPSFDESAAHRWFAVELNNRAWDLLQSSERSETDTEDMLSAAHGSRYHWLRVGSIANHARGACLVANVHSEIGEEHPALRHAERCIQLIESHPGEMADWDYAFAYDAMARALAAAGRQGEARGFKGKARRSADRIADPQDKEIFDQWFASGNWHGLE
ncbi:MAG: hypothetical protein ACE5NC_03095 [Anaerolineae bacterium]